MVDDGLQGQLSSAAERSNEQLRDESSRAQTTLDFAVGISIFIVVLATSLAMIPSLFAPFGDSGATDGMVADRVSDRLSNGFLATGSGETGRIDTRCTTEFFDADGDTLPRCSYDTDAESLSTALGVVSYRVLNVTIENASGVYMLRGVELAAGSTPTESAKASVSRRLVLADDRALRLYVRVW